MRGVAAAGLLLAYLALHQPLAGAQEPEEAQPEAPTGRGRWLTIIESLDDPSVAVSYTDVVAQPDALAVAPAVRQRRCELWLAPGGPGSQLSENMPFATAVEPLVADGWYYQTCRYVDDDTLASSRYFQYQPGSPGFGVDLAALAMSAYDQIPLPYPVPHTAPGLERPHIVGLPTWLWIDPGQWQTRTATAAIPGFSVTVTATPDRVTWNLGERDPDQRRAGRAVTCRGPGEVYDFAGGDGQHSDCAYTYQWISSHQPEGRYHATATQAWAVTWQASTGQTGTLAEATRTTSFDLTVDEIEATICYQPDPDDCD